MSHRPRGRLETADGNFTFAAGGDRNQSSTASIAEVPFAPQNQRCLSAEAIEGVSVTDTRGRKHTPETRPNVLHRLAATGGEQYEQVYRLVTSFASRVKVSQRRLS
jgi:hypothetical protein